MRVQLSHTLAVLAFLATTTLIAEPTHAQTPAARFGNTLSEPQRSEQPVGSDAPASQDGRRMRIVEAIGQGSSELQARKAAVESAIEQAVGIFIDSRRRSEMNLTDGKLHEVVDEQIQTYSSAFVEKVETISTERTDQNGFKVKIRAFVAVPALLEAMSDAKLPTASVDAVSNQEKFAGQARMAEDASALVALRLRDLAELIKPQIDPQTISATLNPSDRSLAALKGQVAFTLDPEVLGRFRANAKAFRSSKFTDKSTMSRDGFQSTELPPSAAAREKGVQFSICDSNNLGQASCHGEQVDWAPAFGTFKGLEFEVSLLSGNDIIGIASSLIRIGCVRPGSTSIAPGYLEAPYDPVVKRSFLWDYEYSAAMSRSARPNGELWADAKTRLTDAPVALYVTAMSVLDGPSGPPLAGSNDGSAGPHGACIALASYTDVRLTVAMKPGPLGRYFYVVGPRAILEKVDGLKASIKLAAPGQ